jgi:hypothetical protein
MDRQVRADLGCHGLCRRDLSLAQVGRRIIVVLRPNQLPGVDVYESRRDPDALAYPLDSPLHQHFQSKQPAHESHRDPQPLVTPDRAGRNHINAVQLGQVRHQQLGQALRECVLVQIGGQSFERDHGQAGEIGSTAQKSRRRIELPIYEPNDGHNARGGDPPAPACAERV